MFPINVQCQPEDCCVEPQEGNHFTCQRSTWTLCECVKTIKRKAPPFPLLYFKESWYEEGPGALISSREHRGEGFNLYFGSLLVYACTDAPTTILFAEASMNPSITVL